MKIKIHSFNTLLAEKFGIKEAILIQYFQSLIERDKANNLNLIEGRTWIKTPLKSLFDNFSYMTKNQLRYAIEKLESQDVLISKKIESDQFNATKWYAFKNEFEYV